MPPPTPLPRIIPVPVPPLQLPTIPAPRNPFPQRRYTGVRPTTRPHSIGEKADFHERKWFEDHYGVKKNINGPHPFHQWSLKNTIISHISPGCEEGKTLSCLDYFFLLFPPKQLIQMTLYIYHQLVKHEEKVKTSVYPPAI